MTIPEVRMYRLTREIGSLKPDLATALMSGQAMVDKRLAVMAYPRAVGHQSPGFALLDWNNFHRLHATCNEYAYTYFAISDHGAYNTVGAMRAEPAEIFELHCIAEADIKYTPALWKYVLDVDCDVRLSSLRYLRFGDSQEAGIGWDSLGTNLVFGVIGGTMELLCAGQITVNGDSVLISGSPVKIGGLTNYLEVDNNGYLKPRSSTDAAAPNGSFYYSTTASKLVFKDSGGTVNNLY